MKMHSTYIRFYLDGRGDDLLDDSDVDEDDLVEKALAGPDDVATIARAVADKLAAPLALDRERREWLADNTAAIKEAGGDASLAFDHYIKGRVDQYSHSLEDDLVTAMFKGGDEDEDDEDEDEDDEDEDDDDEDGDED